MSLLTIVTVNLDNASGLEQTLRSVADQTARECMQVVIVDGASKDHSLDVIARYEGVLGATVVSEPDDSNMEAMNKGLALATGRYTLFLNSGDYFVDPDVVADFHDHISARGESRSVVMGQIKMEGVPVPPANKPYTFSRHLLGLCMHRHPASFIPTDLAQALGGYPETYGFAGDYDLMLRASFAVGLEEWDRVCSVFLGGGVSSRNLDKIPALLAQVRRDRLQPVNWLAFCMAAYDRVYAWRHRAGLRRARYDGD